MTLHYFMITLPLLLSLPQQLQSARLEYLAARGWPYSRLVAEHCLPVAYRWEWELPDAEPPPPVPLRIATWVTEVGAHRYTIRQTATLRGRVVASAVTRVCNYDCEEGRSRELPGELREALNGSAAGSWRQSANTRRARERRKHMPFGQHIARCLKCGKQWDVGDCIPTFCSKECEEAHTKWWAEIQERYHLNTPRPQAPGAGTPGSVPGGPD